MIRITYKFQTGDEALQFLARDKAHPPVESRPVSRPRTTRAVAPAQTNGNEVPVAAASKVTNQPVQAVAGAPTPIALATSAPPPPPAQTATLDTVRIALREVFNTKGAKTATGILTQFGAMRVSDIKPEQFAAFIAACGA